VEAEIVKPWRLLASAAALAGGSGMLLLGEQTYLKGKGWLAGRLIERAYAAHLADGKPHRPWSWADHRPIAGLELRRIVLSGASGGSMAFGLAHLDGTALPGERGNCVLAGHRNTWASFLERLRVGDELQVETRAGRLSYRVHRLSIVRKEAVEVLEPSGDERLTFITCYPFRGLASSPWRYVVTCPRIPASAGR
jgi:sortase A